MEGNSFNSYVFYWFLNTSLNRGVCPSQGRYKVVIDTTCGILTSLVLKLQDLYSKTYIWKRKKKEVKIPCRHLFVAAQYLGNGYLWCDGKYSPPNKDNLNSKCPQTLPILVTHPNRASVVAQFYGPWVALVSHSLSVFSTPSSSPYGCSSPPAQVLRWSWTQTQMWVRTW